MGMQDYADRQISQLSGGEIQSVVIARVLAQRGHRTALIARRADRLQRLAPPGWSKVRVLLRIDLRVEIDLPGGAVHERG